MIINRMNFVLRRNNIYCQVCSSVIQKGCLNQKINFMNYEIGTQELAAYVDCFTLTLGQVYIHVYMLIPYMEIYSCMLTTH